MTRLSKIWSELSEMKFENQVLNFFETRQTRIIDILKTAETSEELELAGLIIHRFARAFNEREMYSSVYYLFISAYVNTADRITGKQEDINELKYELARGLHHNRKYKYSKQLFNELADTEFDTKRIDFWWNQSAFASTRDEIWIKTHILPSVTRFLLMIAYLTVVLWTKIFVISTIVFIGLFLFVELQWFLYKVNYYLKEFENNPDFELIKRKIKNKIVIQFGISILIFPIYYWGHDLIYLTTFIIAIYLNVYHYGLELYYLPKLIATQNRKKASN
ncbi:hypothetical protein [Alkalitalea saponilacus]|uniref:Uncharacterized protein n=1 Tax=Alkalitalea saponilacus TaxID=889453 RepID=A0A1T5HUF8_9BACT|nr:hypothetical protein [Alkalitalea saponilacus]ASB50479.1 hypothetical protein CDL62_15645 [Alkalitalea saponilacus]ASB50490.1 hypothetical protein CDL62_15705 [Alkalitalea saponilacus]SKC24287.1 hypothetical protein SAMN03080601_03586 [Alkalitalea saponilacus]